MGVRANCGRVVDIRNGDRIGHLGIGSLHAHGVGGDFHDFGHLADFERDGLGNVGRGVQLDAFHHRLAEAGGLHAKRIVARLQCRQHVIAGGVGGGFGLTLVAELTAVTLALGTTAPVAS